MADTWTVAAYLARRLRQAGAGHLFGVPGDFCLPFFDAAVSAGPEVVVTCNELNAGYAADGYARRQGIGALAVTWNVGTFSALNAIAGASAERVPVVAVCGAPPRATRPGGVLHHTAGVPGAQGRAVRALVRNAVRLDDPQAAPALVDAALARCLADRRPVYVELPVDVSRAPCAAPGAFAPSPPPAGDPAALDEAVARAAALLAGAGDRGVTVLAGVELARFGLGDEAIGLVEHLGARFVTTVHAKAVLPETHPAFAGVYIGELGDDGPREAVDGGGAVLALGSLLTDLDLGLDTARFERRRLVAAAGDRVRVGRRVFRGVTLRDFVRGLRAAAPPGRPAAPPGEALPEPLPGPAAADAPLTSRRCFELARRAIGPRSVVLADVGDAMLSVAGLPMPGGATVLCQAFYASVGWSLPAAVGASFAEPARPLLAFAGDGAFQMTGQELSTLVRHRRGATVVVLDNGGYLMERTLHEGPFNDLNPWRYAELAAVYGGPPGLVAATEGELEAALARAAAHPRELTLVQARLGPNDASRTLRRFGAAVHAARRAAAGPQPETREAGA